ncbi:hypothetical protein Scep_029956 [Stephania cephalantha]|uniref:Uncharacterized protein n=1 Tax=Stephania cephalantha TaxID=152367 RepID=A0AAP0DYM9_9MAGN
MIQRNLLEENKRGMEKEKRRERVTHLREPIKMRKKGHETRHVGSGLHQHVRRAVYVVQKWKTLLANEFTMTSTENMADNVLRHLTGKISYMSNGFEEGTQLGSHTVGYASGPSKCKDSCTYQPPKKCTKGKN